MDPRDHGLPEPFTEDLTVRDGVVADPFRLHRRSDVDGAVRTAAMVAQLDLPLEQRIAHALRDVVELPFPDVAEVLGCSAADAQTYDSDARRRMAQVEPPADLSEQYRVMQSFLSVLRTGDVAVVAAVLDPEVVVLSEDWRNTAERQGPAVLRPVVERIVGAEQVARFSLNHLAPAYDPDVLADTPSVTCSDDATVIHTGSTRINGDVGMLAPGQSRNQHGECISVGRATVFSSRSGRIVHIYDWAAAAGLQHIVP
jgi:RNA polymerase sigma-70 factor (ECF subfamily)